MLENRIIKILLFLAIANISYAQIINTVGGVGFAGYHTSDKSVNDNLSANFSLHLGLNYQHYITDFFSIDIGAQYALKGARFTEPIFDSSIGVYLHYIEFPLVARVHFNLFKKDIFLDGGLYRARGVIGHATAVVLSGVLSESIKFDGSESNLEEWDTGFTVGGGYKTGDHQIRFSFDISTSDSDPGIETFRNFVGKISYIRPLVNFKKKQSEGI